MATEEGGEKPAKEPPAPGLMTRGRRQKIKEENAPKQAASQPPEAESLAPQAKAQMPPPDAEKFGNAGGPWYTQPMWPGGPMIRMPEGQKMMPKQPNFFMAPMNPQMAAQFQQRMGQMPPPMAQQMPMHPQQMPMHPGQMGPPGMPPMFPKLAPMGRMMPPGMRPMPFPQKSPSQPPMMPKGMPNVPAMPGIVGMGNVQFPPMYQRPAPKSPTHPRPAARKRYPKATVSPKKAEPFANEGAAKAEEVDLTKLLREEIEKILQQELKRANERYINQPLVPPGSKPDKHEKQLSYRKLQAIIDTLLEGFKPVLKTMWRETKRCHRYSLDEWYHALNPKEGGHERDHGGPKAKKKKKTPRYELEVVRDFGNLKTLFQKRDEMERLTASYRKNSKLSFGQDFFTFSNFNAAQSQSLEAAEPKTEAEREQDFLRRAMEYAEVACNQRMLFDTVNALDFRAALAGDRLKSYLPSVFRTTLAQAVSALHFDLGSPPPLSPKQARKGPEKDPMLNKLLDTLQNLQNADAKQVGRAHAQFKPNMATFTHFVRDERLKELLGANAPPQNFMPPGVSMFPGMQPGPPGMMLNMNAMPMGPGPVPGAMEMPPGPPPNAGLPPGMMPPPMAQPMPMPKAVPAPAPNPDGKF